MVGHASVPGALQLGKREFAGSKKGPHDDCVQDLAAGSSVSYSIDLSCRRNYKEFCSDTESYPHTQIDLGSCMYSVVKSNPRAPYHI